MLSPVEFKKLALEAAIWGELDKRKVKTKTDLSVLYWVSRTASGYFRVRVADRTFHEHHSTGLNIPAIVNALLLVDDTGKEEDEKVVRGMKKLYQALDKLRLK